MITPASSNDASTSCSIFAIISCTTTLCSSSVCSVPMVRTLSCSVRIRSRIRSHATEIFWADSLVRRDDIVMAAERDAEGSFSTMPDGVVEAVWSSSAYWKRSRLQEW